MNSRMPTAGASLRAGLVSSSNGVPRKSH